MTPMNQMNQGQPQQFARTQVQILVPAGKQRVWRGMTFKHNDMTVDGLLETIPAASLRVIATPEVPANSTIFSFMINEAMEDVVETDLA